MARKYWNVVTSEGGWRVTEEGVGLLGHFGIVHSIQAEAIHEARQLAQAHHARTGQPTGIRIQGADGRWRDERSYGNDPFPPGG